MKKKLIYLACPYTHRDSRVSVDRFREVNKVAAGLIKEGFLVFSPISHSHPITVHGIRGDFEYWKEFDKAIMDLCEELYVLKLEGWRESKGVAFEMSYMESKGKPVVYVEPEDYYKEFKIEYDSFEWIWKLHLPDGTTISHPDKSVLERYMDLLDAEA